jgi:signal peptidase I
MTVRKKKKKNNTFLRLLCRVLGTVLIAAVFAILLPLNIPKLFGNQVYNVVSGSMAPEIPIGSIIVVQPADPVSIQTDDVIAFMKGNSVVTHRVTSNNSVEGRFKTKGDANEMEDINAVTYDEFVGKVVWHAPYLGGIAQIMTSTIGKIYLLAVLACGIMFHMIAGQLKVLAE